MQINPELLIKVGKKIVVTIAPIALAEAKKYWNGNHGSKVKLGAFQDCKIEMFGNKACIVVDNDAGEIVLLTRENIKTCQFVKQKFSKSKMKEYYYYEIEFEDGKQSYIRVSKKYLEVLLDEGFF